MALPSFVAGGRPLGPLLQALLPIRAAKAADTTLVSTTTFSNDPDLFIGVSANCEYDIAVQLFYTQGAVGQLLIAWTAPALATFDWMAVALDNSVTASNAGSVRLLARTVSDTQQFGGNTSPGAARVTGRLVVGTTPGTLQLRWAPSASSGTGTVVKAGSYMVGTQIA